MVRKEFLQSEQKTMDAAVFVDRAREMAAELEDMEVLTVRSRPIARQRVARIIGIPPSLLHSLRYRPPKTIAADVYARLCAAIERCAELQIRKLENDIHTACASRRSISNCNLSEIETSLENARSLLREWQHK